MIRVELEGRDKLVAALRARLGHFPLAGEVVRLELEAHASEQGGDSWRRHTPTHHARHAAVHFLLALAWSCIGLRRLAAEHFAHGCTRGLMALERFIHVAGDSMTTPACGRRRPELNRKGET